MTVLNQSYYLMVYFHQSIHFLLFTWGKKTTKTQAPSPQPAPPVPEHQTIPRLADKYLSSMVRVYLGASSGTPHSGGSQEASLLYG